MPEHRRGTPGRYHALESFLWRDFGSAEEWAAWAEAQGLGGSAARGAASFDKATKLQTALRVLEASNNGESDSQLDADSATSVLNRLIHDMAVRPSLDPLVGVRLETNIGTRYAAVGAMLVMALNAMTTGDWRRFKLCLDPECRASYYDSSRSATKIWCSMEGCGSRNKMRRHRARAVE